MKSVIKPIKYFFHIPLSNEDLNRVFCDWSLNWTQLLVMLLVSFNIQISPKSLSLYLKNHGKVNVRVGFDLIWLMDYANRIFWLQNIIAGAFKPPCKISISLTHPTTRKQVNVRWNVIELLPFSLSYVTVCVFDFMTTKIWTDFRCKNRLHGSNDSIIFSYNSFIH